VVLELAVFGLLAAKKLETKGRKRGTEHLVR
jgi:hypothetical protein